MKKILLLAVAAGFVFSSCKKDDDDQNLIIGTWKVNKFSYKYGNGSSETEIPDECAAKSTIVFKEDGALISNDYYKTGGNCVSDNDTGTYSYNESGKTLAMNLEDNTINFKVLNLTNSELALQGENDDYDGDGTDDEYIIYLKR